MITALVVAAFLSASLVAAEWFRRLLVTRPSRQSKRNQR